MPRNLSGVYTLPAGNPVVPGTTIDANWANSTLADISNELTNSLSRTGAGGMLAPFRIDDGNVTGPGLAFLNETNTGYFRSGAGATAFSVLGVSTLQLNTTAVTVPSTRTLNAQGNALVGGTFGVTGVAAFGSTIAVTGAITALGGVLGNITAASGTSTFADVVITGSLDMTVGSSATITGLSTPVNASDAANKSYVDTQVATRLALTGGTMSGAIAMSTNKITGLGTPTADTDAATKAYVDSVAQGLDVKGSVRAATTGNITLSGAQTIDGVAVIAGDRVLVKDQSTAANNGIYVAAAGAWSRAADADTWNELVGAFVFVEDGATNDNSGWVCTSPPGGTLGVTAVTFEQFSGAGQINAGTGMTKNGNTLNVNTASASRIVVGADEIDLAQTGVTAGTYKSVTVDLYGRVTAGTNPTTLAGYGISDAYTTAQTDSLLAQRLALTGGTMSGALAMGTNRITGVGDPVNAQDAATKNYIDTIFGSTTSAAASAAAAASSASAASTSASNAATSASNASSSASAAATSASNAATSLFNFRAQYLGPLASDPTVDGNGNAVATGDLYWNTVANEMRVYSGTAWVPSYLTTGAQTITGVKTFASNPILDAGTANGVAYLNGSKVLTTGSALTFDGTSLSVAIVKRDVDNSFVTLLGGTSSATSAAVYATGPSYAAASTIYIDSAETVFRSLNGVSSRMALTSTGLGIGTSSPGRKLHVAATGTSYIARFESTDSLAVVNFKGSATGDFTVGAGANGENLVFLTSTTERARIDSSGNVGIGTSSPTTKLDVNGDARIGGTSVSQSLLTIGGGSTSAAMNLRGATGSAYAWQISSNAFVGSALEFTRSTAVGGTTFSTPSMLLDSSGNLGIGTSSPGSRLDVSGVISLQGTTLPSAGTARIFSRSSDSGFYLQSATGGTTYLLDGSQNTMAGFGSSTIFFATGNTERARISSDGTFRVKGAGTAGSTDAVQFAGTAPASAMSLDSSGNLLVGTTTTVSGSNHIVVGSNAIQGTKNDFTNLGTTAQSFGFQATNAGAYIGHLVSVGGAKVSFILSTYFDNSGIYIYTTTLGGCTAGGTAQTISGINNDSRTYTFSRNGGTGLLEVTASSTATGTTTIYLTPLNVFG